MEKICDECGGSLRVTRSICDRCGIEHQEGRSYAPLVICSHVLTCEHVVSMCPWGVPHVGSGSVERCPHDINKTANSVNIKEAK